MQQLDCGLTETFNRFHDQSESSTGIKELREIHVELDQAVIAAYGWSNVHLDCDFRETKQGIRFTASESTRRDLLNRLLRLNQERFNVEVGKGLHGKNRNAKSRGQKSKAKKSLSLIHI